MWLEVVSSHLWLALLFSQRSDWGVSWLLFIEKGSLYVALTVLELDTDIDQASLELIAIILPLAPKCWE